MRIFCRGVAKIRHCESGEIHEINADDLDWNAVGADECGMGSEIHYEAIVEHDDLGIVSWGVWEYPAGVENYQDTDAGQHFVIQDFDYGLEHEEEPEDWLNYAPPTDPYTIYMDSYHHAGDLLAEHGKDRGDYLLNRMIFSHQITALEAYLGDTLTNEVMNDQSALQRLISEAEDLKAEKFALADIANNPRLVEDKAKKYLRGIMYHNLAKVDALYKIVLEIKILDLVSDRSRLFEAVKLRHDCVHRNGFDADGGKLMVFTKEFVQQTADLVKSFVRRIEGAVITRSK